MPLPGPDLSQRQRQILICVVEEYVATGQPVGSKNLVERAGLQVSSATVRNELAERLGLLTHPHTSAGRFNLTDGRYYVDCLLERPEGRPASFPLTSPKRSGSSRAQATTEMLSGTRLIALVSAAAPDRDRSPRRGADAQPQIVMVVAINLDVNGGIRLRPPGRPGLANWAAQSNDQRRCPEAPSCAGGWPTPVTGMERRPDVVPAFLEGEADSAPSPGRAGLLEEVRDEMGSYRSLIDLLERRRAMLDLLAEALDPRRLFVASATSSPLRASTTSRSSAPVRDR
jgi:hypothetical protein